MPSKTMMSWSLKKTDRVDGGAPTGGVAVRYPVVHAVQVKRGCQLAVAMVLRHERCQGDEGGTGGQRACDGPSLATQTPQ